MSQQNQNAPDARTSNNILSSPANDPESIHRRAIAIDMHADTTQRMVDEHLDINQRLTDGQLDAVRMKEGGLDAQFFSIWVEPQLYGVGGQGAVKRADEQIAAVRELVSKHADTWELAQSAADIRRIAGEG
ncbi:MAG TPA: membrane dipeptidase, partial [Pyrinomonadaceae bacterium]|nr:membrane dipeptidase [Pyrinomonadaceae bacterium]